jgi:hypothetical protein
MSEGPLEETWEAWTARVSADLAALGEDDWLTFTVHVPSQASSTYAAEHVPRGWRRGHRPARHPAVPDVFVQARVLEGVLALECIGDTEFEGLTDLTRDAQEALVGLGWVRDGDEPEFSRAFGDDGVHDVAAPTAAALLVATLAGVLGARSPAEVEVRRAPQRTR